MKAVLSPLTGRKYYGTEVEISGSYNDQSFGGGLIQIWVMGNYKPSRRELENWNANEYNEDEEYEICDSHYETETSLEIAEKLVGAINVED